MKFKAGMSKRRIRYATSLFQKNPEITMAEVSRHVKTRYGTGMAARLLDTCRLTAEAERDAKREHLKLTKKEAESLRKNTEGRSIGVESADGKSYAKKPKLKAPPPPQAHYLEVSTRWTTPTVKHTRGRNGFKAEFYEGLKMVRAALLGSTFASGVVHLTLANEKITVDYDLQERVEKTGQFEVKD